MSVSLIYIPSQSIVDYIAKNPIDWMDEHRDLARRGGAGDQAGMPPTPAVYEFLSLFHNRQGLFTQRDYQQWCFRQWAEWLREIKDSHNFTAKEKTLGLVVKCYRNFYPSMIDSLHVWALLIETGRFDKCILDSSLDSVGKTDITVFSDSSEYHLSLMAGSKQAQMDRDYKSKYRSGGVTTDSISITLSLTRPKQPGNKRWYEPDDFSAILDSVARRPQSRRVQPALL